MVIRNKDGSVYKLSSPNPLVKDQTWSKDYILHNLQWDDIKLEGEIKQAVEELVKHPVIEEPVPEPIPEPPIEIPEPIPEPKPEIIDRSQEKPRTLKNIVIFHCLPTISDNSKEYNKKFDFEGVFVSRNDLETILWTNLKISKGSIVYPSRYADGSAKFSEYRWWRVSDVLPKANGYLMRAVISDICPDFSD